MKTAYRKAGTKMNPYIKAAGYIAEIAGIMLQEKIRSTLNIEHKGRIDIVTEMDKKSEELITGFLMEKFPDHSFVAEEGTKVDGDSGFVWFIDPLDGTSNYAHNIPWYAVSIGLHKDGAPFAGVVHNPANGEMFTAQAGEGVFLNGEPIKTSDRGELSQCVFATGFPYYIKERPERVMANLQKFLVNTHGVRRFGAAALDLAYVAAGIYDGFWEEGLKPWDTAAGILMVMEAGGKVSDYCGDNYNIRKDTIVASNGKIHSAMVELIRRQAGK